MEHTYKIIGVDGVEYGPVALDELKRWVMDGRVAGGTHVWRSDLSKWSPASGYVELEPELGEVTEIESQAAVRPVGFWLRVGAYLIDVMVLQGIFLAIWGPVPEAPAPAHGLPDLMAMLRELGPRLGYQVAIQLIYTVLLNGQFGATLGKLAIGARIVNIDGSAISFGKALLRWLAMIPSNLTLGIGYVLVAVRPDKRALHDLLAKTKVIYRR
jgi:uncharacterized RDD family membrane protein YckC